MNAGKPLIFVVLVAVTSWLLISCTDQNSIFFDIPEGIASQTLNEFASQSSLEIIYNVEEVGTTSTNRVYGKYAFDEALQRMLQGTSLEYAIDEKSGAIAVRKNASHKGEN